MTILFTSVKLRREELNSKTYANDRLVKIVTDESKREHLLMLQEKYYNDKEKIDNLYFKIQESLDQIV
jgi:uncharacterized protein (DUF342 family)